MTATPVTTAEVADAIAESIWHWVIRHHPQLPRSAGWDGHYCQHCSDLAGQRCDDLIAVAEEHDVTGYGTGELLVDGLAQRLLERTDLDDPEAATLAAQMLCTIWENDYTGPR